MSMPLGPEYALKLARALVGQAVKELEGAGCPPDAAYGNLVDMVRDETRAYAIRATAEAYEKHVAETIEKYGRHSDTSCPPLTRQMCSYRPRVNP